MGNGAFDINIDIEIMTSFLWLEENLHGSDWDSGNHDREQNMNE